MHETLSFVEQGKLDDAFKQVYKDLQSTGVTPSRQMEGHSQLPGPAFEGKDFVTAEWVQAQRGEVLVDVQSTDEFILDVVPEGDTFHRFLTIIGEGDLAFVGIETAVSGILFDSAGAPDVQMYDLTTPDEDYIIFPSGSAFFVDIKVHRHATPSGTFYVGRLHAQAFSSLEKRVHPHITAEMTIVMSDDGELIIGSRAEGDPIHVVVTR